MGLEDDFILGGFDYDLMYYRLATFATTAIESVPNLDPFERQPGVIPHPEQPDRGDESDPLLKGDKSSTKKPKG
jgi:hypothetical protein